MLAEAIIVKLIKIAGIIIGGGLIDRVVRRLSKQAINHKFTDQRAKTLLDIIQNSASFILGLMILAMVLSELGVNIAPLIASAGILGLAVGFGAQTLVKDLISGLFLLLDDTIRTDELVKVAGIQGKVKKVGIRTLVIEDDDGVIHTIPNGSITTVSNFNRKSKE